MDNGKVKRVGILTSGGDAPGLNAAIYGLCKTGIEKYNIEFFGFQNGYKGLESGKFIKIKNDDLENLFLSGGTFLGSSREKPFKNKEKIKETNLSALDSIKKYYKDLKLDALVVLGGNGSCTTASLLSQEGFNVIALPKTIDNDIAYTDYTFGFRTAVDIVTESIERIRTTALSHSRVMVIEAMGHKVGWIALESAIATAADVVLLPEIPYDKKNVIKKILDNKQKQKKYSIVIVSEGALDKQEAKLDKKAFKKMRASMNCTVGQRIAKEIEAATGIETRATILGYLQRGGSPNPYDRMMAIHFGSMGANFIARKDFGKILIWKDSQVIGIALSEVAGITKTIPLESPLLETAKNIGICFGD